MIAPYAWLYTRSYGKKLKKYSTEGNTESKNLNDQKWFKEVSNQIYKEEKINTPEACKKFKRETQIMIGLVRFIRSGMQVFDFTPELVEELSQTDIDEIKTGDLNIPYKSFYIRALGMFKTKNDIEIDGFFIDETNVSKFKEIIITVVPVMKNPEDFINDYAQMPIATIIKNENNSIFEAIEKINDHTNKITEKFENDHNEEMKEVKYRSNMGKIFLQENLNSIINMLLYIDKYRGNENTVWPNDAPQDLLEKIKSKKAGYKKAEKKLTALGWTKVRLCGSEFAHRSSGKKEGRQPRAHWRRGHWRRQNYGAQNSQNRLIRIRPVVVGKGKIAEGRIYKTG